MMKFRYVRAQTPVVGESVVPRFRPVNFFGTVVPRFRPLNFFGAI